MASNSLILSANELSNLLKSGQNVKILDASWFMPNSPRDAKAEFAAKRIPGAQYLDLDEVASPHELGLKHMMPSGSTFAKACANFCISPSTSVILYDSHGVFSSPRALFMFRSFGHTNSSVLNGGLPIWEHAGLPVETGDVPQQKVVEYPTPQLDVDAVRDYQQMVTNSLASDAEIVLDARSKGRYMGADPEPRPGLSSGHIPKSSSLPFNAFLSNVTANGTQYTVLKSAPEIRQVLVEALGESQVKAILNREVSVATTCGSGMTAAILWLGLKLLNVEHVGLYDESWTGYAMRPSSTIHKSP